MMKNKLVKGKDSQFKMRVSEDLRYFLSYIMRRATLSDPKLQSLSDISLLKVNLSPDLKRARVFCSFLHKDNNDIQETILSLNKAQSYFKKELAKHSNLRYIPSLSFVYDKTIDINYEMMELLNKL